MVGVYFVLSIRKLNELTEKKLNTLNMYNSQLMQKSASAKLASLMQEHVNTL